MSNWYEDRDPIAPHWYRAAAALAERRRWERMQRRKLLGIGLAFGLVATGIMAVWAIFVIGAVR